MKSELGAENVNKNVPKLVGVTLATSYLDLVFAKICSMAPDAISHVQKGVDMAYVSAQMENVTPVQKDYLESTATRHVQVDVIITHVTWILVNVILVLGGFMVYFVTNSAPLDV